MQGRRVSTSQREGGDKDGVGLCSSSKLPCSMHWPRASVLTPGEKKRRKGSVLDNRSSLLAAINKFASQLA